ncbi:MAG TPA: hypothetical protein VN961_12095, partial [Streptosporangiaceae bacterium]|nr:hypothetical protein [Streptosporangiaceae bacterium]
MTVARLVLVAADLRDPLDPPLTCRARPASGVGVERPDGEYWMPLFVVLNPGHELDDALTGKIRQAIREKASPRHVPDEIIAALAIPHTRTGKKLEIPSGAAPLLRPALLPGDVHPRGLRSRHRRL